MQFLTVLPDFSFQLVNANGICSRFGEKYQVFLPPSCFLVQIIQTPNWIISKNWLRRRKRERKKFVEKKLFNSATRKMKILLVFRKRGSSVNSENDERRGAVNWQCLDSGAKSKIHPNIRRGIFLSCKPLRSIFTSATECFTPLPLLTAPIFYILAPFCISLA